MNYLADTQILLWSFLEHKKLPEKIKQILMDENNNIFYSPVSLWEISIKFGIKKIILDNGTPEDFFSELGNSFFQCKNIIPAVFVTIYKLPYHHKDPFDRFLIWDAINSDFVLLSSDEKMELYKNEGLKAVF